MSKRIYIKKSIIDLEELYEGNKDKKKLCSGILYELSFRKTARAKRLENKIKQMLNGDELAPQLTRDQAVEQEQIIQSPPDVDVKPGAVRTKPKLVPKPAFTNEIENILRAWTTLELLSPQGFRREQDLTPGNRNGIARLDSTLVDTAANGNPLFKISLITNKRSKTGQKRSETGFNLYFGFAQ